MKKYGFLILIGFDQVTKALAFLTHTNIISKCGIGIQGIKSKGILFGFFTFSPCNRLLFTLLMAIDLFIIVSFFRFYIKEYRQNHLISVSFLLVTAGFAGNFLDGLILGYVRDFISVPIIESTNFSDIFIFTGISLLIIELATNRVFRFQWIKSESIRKERHLLALSFSRIIRDDFERTKSDLVRIKNFLVRSELTGTKNINRN
jgi:lipoprotein signal peptidase